MAVLTDKEYALVLLGKYNVSGHIAAAVQDLQDRGRDVSMIPELVKELAEIVIMSTTKIKED